MPWWGILLIALGALILGGLIVYVLLMIYFARGIHW